MHREIKTKSVAPQIIIRLLNGILKGCEFELGNGKTLFIVGKESDVLNQTHLPTFPENTIFIPVTSEGTNFEIQVNEENNVFLQPLHSESETEKNNPTAVVFNKIVKVGQLAFSIKAINTPWVSEILAYPVQKKVAPKPRRLAKKARLLLWGAVGVFTLMTALSIAQIKKADDQQQTKELSSLLGDSEGKYQILPGHDGWIYILANNDKEMAWARQALIRFNSTQQVRVLSVQQEEKRIGLWLSENWSKVKYHRIRIETPRSPKVLISKERTELNDDQRTQLIKALNQQIPYAQQSQLLSISDKEVVYQAESGIKKMAVPYTRHDNGSSVTFVIQGALDDSQLQQLRSFVTHYTQAWGEHYVKFSVELKDDWLKGKSFKYGDQGYIKVSPGYWYFPKPL
ncbi:PrgH/EprH family type III secretion apparatus protein [Candidatus Regiella endosymbiont of Tuberolachnus salignus]|uniref:PrgH/EprH family type III secretion apparatus protein n=1 Tax=Candidatus Regiella endosymbiont of Tuberolachnus salignus TaxID=3077956 RepID=UPI0030D53012